MRTAGVGWARVAATALDLVVPQQCAGCAAPGTAWCAACSHSCATGSRPVPLPVPGRAAAEHGGPAGRAVVAFKDEHVRRLAGPLGRMLAGAVRDALADAGALRSGGGVVWLVPVPSRRGAARARGADHMGVLAGRAARELRGWGIPAHRCRALELVRTSRDQVGLSRGQRLRNVQRTMRALDVPAGPIVLVDDVTTTGATLGEALRALTEHDQLVSCAATVTTAVPSRRRASRTRPG